MHSHLLHRTIIRFFVAVSGSSNLLFTAVLQKSTICNRDVRVACLRIERIPGEAGNHPARSVEIFRQFLNVVDRHVVGVHERSSD
jgi:hypothetical protein